MTPTHHLPPPLRKLLVLLLLSATVLAVLVGAALHDWGEPGLASP